MPKAAGVYAWYFAGVPGPIDVSACHSFDGMPMLYVGIAPKRPYKDGRRSSSTLHQRVLYHFKGNAEGSTLRLTLGCLLAGSLGIELRRVGSGARRTFSDGEWVLSEWMQRNARVCWQVHPEPWDVEEQLIHRYDLPLNLDQNKRNAFHPELTAAREEGQGARRRASRRPEVAGRRCLDCVSQFRKPATNLAATVATGVSQSMGRWPEGLGILTASGNRAKRSRQCSAWCAIGRISVRCAISRRSTSARTRRWSMQPYGSRPKPRDAPSSFTIASRRFSRSLCIARRAA
jgi:hypothetical protein